MKIITNVNELKDFRKSSNFQNKRTGFVPTMGALHDGHLSLIEKAKNENDIAVVSIFVNPRQFNDANDYKNYIIKIEDDIKLLESVNCDLLFFPSNEDIYNNYEGYSMDFKGLDRIYEGEFRPGHFQGVVDIVYRLFSLVEPQKAYFGEKDFQQLAIIKLMTRQANLNIEIIPCSIVRETSGLAMSSRNFRLTEYQKNIASKVYAILRSFQKSITISDNPAIISEDISGKINLEPLLKSEYVVFCDNDTLKSVEKFERNTVIRLCVAFWCEKVRLIDNISLQF